MREILFRGKQMDNGEWLFGDLRHIFHGEYRTHIVDNSNGLNNGVCGLEVASSTVGQFTGLTDRNGVKIFEGDIVRYGQRGKVEYNSGSAQFTLNFTNSTYEGFDKIPFCDCEVLGNIHDNPELLEVSGDEP
jgi:uncharacterized phage protein (TIGR01671 family)